MFMIVFFAFDILAYVWFGAQVILRFFFKKMGLVLFIFRSLQMSNSIDGELGIRTQGGRMVGEDESIELWRQPSCVFSVIHCNTISTYRISSANKVAIFNNYRAILDISLK